jgi:1-deoxy-D-xylulose-5-phosphate reductoisomerase
VLAQMGNPDMRTPIAHAMSWPERMVSGVEALDLYAVARLEFETPDLERFPALRLARDACKAGGTATTVLNAANEVAVEAFLDHRLPFTGITAVIEDSLERIPVEKASSLDVIYRVDKLTRKHAQAFVEATAGGV